MAAIADGDRGPGKRFIRDGALDHLKRGLQLRFAANLHRLQCHRIFRQLETET